MVWCRWLIAVVLVLTVSTVGVAQDPPPERRQLRVGTKVVRPFAFKDEGGQWKGISIDLWRSIATKMNFETEWFEYESTDALIKAAAGGEVDVAVAAITMKPSRARKVDFSHSFFKSGLSICARRQQPGAWSIVSSFFSLQLLKVIGMLVTLLFVVGALAWLVERKKNPDEFGGSVVKGLWEGFWWSAVTMTTVGYGDKSPRSGCGRVLGLVWMFASLIMISYFTAAVASTLTTQKLQAIIRGEEDLPYIRVGAKANESPYSILQERGIYAKQYASVKEGLEAVSLGKIDAFVHDQPVMQYEILADGELAESVMILPRPIREEEYGIAFRPPVNRDIRNKLREAVNVTLLELKISGEYGKIIKKYLGQ